MSESKFGKMRLSIQGTNNGRGFDILYDFGKSMDFVEFQTKREFMFIQPWMQFPAPEYTDECMRVSIEFVRRFNDFEAMQDRISVLEKALAEYRESRGVEGKAEK